MATSPSWLAGTEAKAPLNAPTGVRAAPAITTWVMGCLPLDSLVRTLGSTASAPCGLGRSRHLPIRIGPGRVSHNRPKGRARKVRGRPIGGGRIGGAGWEGRRVGEEGVGRGRARG